MMYKFDINSQIKRILKRVCDNDFNNKSDSCNTIQDFYDGYLYKSLLLDSENGERFSRKEALTFMLNTDGIAKSHNSDQTIWPIYLVINELPLHMRFCMENTIIAGLSVGFKKPDFEYFFLSPIFAELISLNLKTD
jgi:hypothetical protein